MDQKMCNRMSGSASHRYRLRAAALVGFSLLWAGGCSVDNSANATSVVSRGAGTLHYVGVFTGDVTFPTAQCSALNGKLLSFTAPIQPDSGPAPAGPMLTYSKAIQSLEFTLDSVNGDATNTFMRGHSDGGLSWRKVRGSWVLHLDHIKIYNADVLNQKSITLNGSLVCTHPTG